MATEHSWGDQPSIDELVEGPAASHGFAAQRREFAAATKQIAEATELSHEQVIHDYWLVRSLYALSRHMPEDGVLRRSGGQWAFGGGTSLTAAWRFVRRYSEDIDGVLLRGGRLASVGEAERSQPRVFRSRLADAVDALAAARAA